ncbi:MAG: preprotein translocase subunit SecE [Flavobacteriales bacterium Tduv]
MKKPSFFTDVYDEFMHRIIWSKWNKLQSSTLVVALSTILLSSLLYGIDELFIWILKQLFSLGF